MQLVDLIMAPNAQAALASLEKANAPIQEQVQQAALFAGVDLTTTPEQNTEKSSDYHGREEWALKWLLKKLAAGADARSCAEAWTLLARLVIQLPMRSAARTLNERKFMDILKATVVGLRSGGDRGERELTPSKKRKRNGDIVSSKSSNHADSGLLLEAIYATVNLIVGLGEARGTETFKAEYMKSVLKTTAEDASEILGGWLSIFAHHNEEIKLLKAFVEVWSSRTLSSEDSAIFARDCLDPLLSLLASADRSHDQRKLLEELAARNLVVPTKAAYITSGKVDSFKDMVVDVVTRQPLYSSIIFDVVINCVPQREHRRRKNQDTAWLQAVFAILFDSVEASSSAATASAIKSLLQKCLVYNIDLELNPLRSLTQRTACNVNNVDWDIVATIVKLDANVFLIAEGDEDLQPVLFDHITHGPLQSTWAGFADNIIDGVLVPLIGEFARARKLEEFVHLWYKELSVHEKMLKGRAPASGLQVSTWTDEALQIKFREVMEAHLSSSQIVGLIEFVAEKSTECLSASLVILDAVVGGVSKEETLSAVHLRPWTIVSSSKDWTSPTSEETWRCWRIARRIFEWQTPASSGDAWKEAKLSTFDAIATSTKLLIEPEAVFDRNSLEIFRCLCSLWSLSPGDKGEDDLIWLQLLHSAPALVFVFAQVVVGLANQNDEKLGEHKWASRSTVEPTKKDYGWFACQYAQCVMVEYPMVLDLLSVPLSTKQKRKLARVESEAKEIYESTALQSAVWIASSTTPHTPEHSRLPWLKNNYQAFPSFWSATLKDERFQDSPALTETAVNTLLECATHLNNPIESSRACNGFVVNCLLQIPVEILTRPQRERILTSWKADSADPSLKDTGALCYRMAPLDAAIFSLKMKVMQRPTLYDGIRFGDFTDTADAIAGLCDQPRAVLPLFAEYANRTLGHVLAAADQPKSQEFLRGLITTMGAWLDENKQAKETLQFARIPLFVTSILSLKSKMSSLATLNVLSESDLDKIVTLYRQTLVVNLQRLLAKPSKLKKSSGERGLSLASTLEALEALQVSWQDFEFLAGNGASLIASVNEVNEALGGQLETFVAQCLSGGHDVVKAAELLRGDLSSRSGRESVLKKASATTASLKDEEKLSLAINLLESSHTNSPGLDRLLAARGVLESCEDSKEATINNDGLALNLSSTYSILATRLPRSPDFREFCIIGETMELMLRTKSRVISQYNIDTTLSSISLVCSPQAQPLPTRHAGDIFLHLTHVLQTVLLSHRLKLQGHFHLVVQVMQALLRCLFTPLSSSSSQITFPPWSQSNNPLAANHARAYVRLLTLLCDPSTSSVSRSSATSLNSATAKAKRLVAQHIPFVLSYYIKLQLDMGLRIVPEVRLELVPGIRAILDTMSVEGRRVLGESLDASGRRILSDLIRDWTRFGKWTGS